MDRKRLKLDDMERKAASLGVRIARVRVGDFSYYQIELPMFAIRVRMPGGGEVDRPPSVMCQNLWEVDRVLDAFTAQSAAAGSPAGRAATSASEAWPAGRTIVRARAMTRQEIARSGWDDAATLLQLDDGSRLFASRDEEGNGPGELFYVDPQGRDGMLLIRSESAASAGGSDEVDGR